MKKKSSKKCICRIGIKIPIREKKYTKVFSLLEKKWSWEDLNLRVLPSAALWPIYICRQITQPELQLQKKPAYNIIGWGKNITNECKY